MVLYKLTICLYVWPFKQSLFQTGPSRRDKPHRRRRNSHGSQQRIVKIVRLSIYKRSTLVQKMSFNPKWMLFCAAVERVEIRSAYSLFYKTGLIGDRYIDRTSGAKGRFIDISPTPTRLKRRVQQYRFR